ncbi:hypothetical protein BG011_009304 [Mortierella polycephala]|uniref:Major facilitator superfamily (MFS) profile domain-containing protein n=1 Tax=Mortierella polycephala TaxID=41804 RepID=A0A9P6QDC8_9FUNG|nr:hypothetical protein BG011_009304 [Mortierella polycephala]
MSHNTNAEELEAKGDLQGDTQQVHPSKILDRAYFTAKEYKFLITGILVQAFLYSFEANIFYSCLPYITATFLASSLGSILPIILQILSAALVPFYTKVSDVVGRAEALTCALVFYLIGYAIQGTSQSFVQLAVGQIAYGIGSTGMLTLTQVLIADTTRLIDRGIIFALWDLPGLVNVFVATLLQDPLTIGKGANWRNVYILASVATVFGAIAILVPLWHLQRKVERMFVKNNRTVERRSIRWLLNEFDSVGALLLTLGMSLTLLPMIVAKTYEGNWGNPTILGLFISGVVSFGLLVVWEIKFTNKPILPMRIWANRTCSGGLVVGFFITVMSSMNWQYFTLYLVVSRNLTFGKAFLLGRGYQAAYAIFQIFTGFAIKRYKTCRRFIWAGIIVHTLGIGLMIPARLPTSSDAFVVISQAIVGAAGGTVTIATTVSVTGAVEKEDVAVIIGMSTILGAFGSAFGNALAGGVWTQYLPMRLALRVTGPYDEDGAMNNPLEYISGLDRETWGQVVEAYADSQLLLSSVAMAFAVFACIGAAFMQHVDLLKDQPPDISLDAVRTENESSESVEEKPKN